MSRGRVAGLVVRGGARARLRREQRGGSRRGRRRRGGGAIGGCCRLGTGFVLGTVIHNGVITRMAM